MTLRGLVVAAALTAGCTHPPKPLPPMPPRIMTSPPEQKAALDDAAGLGLQAETQRWQIEAAKELKDAAEWRKEKAQQESRAAVIPMPPPNDSGAPGGRSDGGER